MTTLQDHMRAGIFTPVQQAGIAALTGPQDRSPSACGCTRSAATASSPCGRSLAAPCEGTFYVWIRLPEGVTPARLLEEHRLVVAPGEGFGPSGRGLGAAIRRDAR